MSIDSSGTVSVTNATSTDIGTLSNATQLYLENSTANKPVGITFGASNASGGPSGTGTSSARVSALASGGVGVFDADLVFETRSGSSIAERMRISSTGAVQIGPDGIQGGALLGVRRMGDSFNFGHINGAGYGSNLGCGNNNGHPYVAFSCEHGTNNNTFKTRGLLGNVIRSMRLTGELKFRQVTNANADNQTATDRLTIPAARPQFPSRKRQRPARRFRVLRLNCCRVGLPTQLVFDSVVNVSERQLRIFNIWPPQVPLNADV